MATIFSKIIAGEIPCHKVAEDERFLAFLDINPLAKAHTLVIPKEELDYIFDIEDELLADMMVFAKKVARAIDKAQLSDFKRVGVAVIGLEVAHAHIHLIPINGVNDINFAKEKLQFSNEELADIAASVSENL